MSQLISRKKKFTLIEDQILEATDKLTKIHEITVYLVLCKFANNETDTCFPARKTIARLARCSEKSVDRAIKTLKEVGLLSVEERRNPDNPKHQLTNLYILEEIPNDFTPRQSDERGATDSPSNYTSLTKEISITNVIVTVEAVLETLKEKASSLDKKNHLYRLKPSSYEIITSCFNSKEEGFKEKAELLKCAPALMYALCNPKCKQSVVPNKKAASLLKALFSYMNEFDRVPTEDEINYIIHTLESHQPVTLSRAMKDARIKGYKGKYDENMLSYIKGIEELNKLSRMRAQGNKYVPKPNQNGASRQSNVSDFDEF